MTVRSVTRGGRSHGRARLSEPGQAELIGPPAPLKHGTSAYRAGKCDCDFCKASHTAAVQNNKALKAEGVDTSLEPRATRVAIARRLLEDGATYAEAANTAHTSEKRLAQELPGYEGNWMEFNSVMAGIKNNETLLQLHREIWQGAEYSRSY